ncbi:hypothetical protein DFH06DRAFT_1401729 [Mycena polygramma]|nr:hypothetical protein DFH06DRAFT_1401729 [Mycena polygramma]
MHKCFNLRNLDRLPFRSRLVALAAASGSVEHIQIITGELMEALTDAPNREAPPDDLLYLPICWTNLDPAGIPSPDELDNLLSASTTGDLLKPPFLAIQLLRFLPHVPQQALVDLWPRVWPWAYFLDTYRDTIPMSPSARHLYATLFQYIDRIPFGLASELPGFRTIVTKAWKVFIATGDSNPRGLDELLNFVDADLATSISKTHLAEYAAGAGGTMDELAATVWEHLAMAEETGNPDYFNSGLRLAGAIEFERASPTHSNPSRFHISLRRRGVVGLLTRVSRRLMLTPASESANKETPGLLTDCLSLLVVEMCHPQGYRFVPEAIRSRLLDIIILLPTTFRSADQLVFLRQLLEKVSESTVYYSVIQEAQDLLTGACDNVLTVAVEENMSPILAEVAAFCTMAFERTKIKLQIESADHAAYRGCDNLDCGKVMQKNAFRSCAGCRTMNYCNKECQKIDWRFHRSVCRNLHSVHIGKYDPLTRRDKSFMRGLVQETWKQNRGTIDALQHHMLNTDICRAFYVCLDYSLGAPSITWKPFVTHDRAAPPLVPPPAALETDFEILQADYEERARQDVGIQLFLVTFPCQPPRIYTMTTHHEFLRVARQTLRESDAEACVEEAAQKLAALHERVPFHTIIQ